MAVGVEQTPTCEITSLPLPILVTEPPKGASFVFEDYHHHFHPRTAPELTGEIGTRGYISGRAVRFSRGQLVPRALHDRYHDIYAGPELPESLEEKFRATILACANVIPRRALDLSKPGESREVDLNEEQYERLSHWGSIYPENAYKDGRVQRMRGAVGKFFADYAMQQYVKLDMPERIINEFINPRVESGRKRELGNLILVEALRASVEPIMQQYRECRIEGCVPEERATQPMEVMRKFFSKCYFKDYHQEMIKRLVRLKALQTGVDELQLAG